MVPACKLWRLLRQAVCWPVSAGCVLSCNRKAKSPADRVGSSFAGHHGPVYSLHR